jgi:hypothetical protein
MEPGVDLTKLSAVLNGLEHGASAMRRHAREATAAVKSGTYGVDASVLSGRIIRECLVLNSRSLRSGRALFSASEVRS